MTKYLPKHPVYVISKGRWKTRYTSKALESMGVPYRIVIEGPEYDDYASVIDPEKILVLPFANLGKGSIPARNWVWEHSVEAGAERHWILDDNLKRFTRLYKYKRVPVKSGGIFCAIEDFVDRYTNIGLAGMQYTSLCVPTKKVYPVTLNTRIYSCILIDNSLPFRWRGRYNEDTDLSLRVLKARWCTALFNYLCCDKMATMRMTGGNTDELYKQNGGFDGRLEMARHLVRQHPDVTRVVWKWGRWQHSVNYDRFKGNKLKPRPGYVPPKTPDEYGMVLRNA